MTHHRPNRHRLCPLSQLEDGDSRGFEFGEGIHVKEVFVVLDGEKLYGYHNSCPHLSTPLEFTPHQFLNGDGSYILCSTHGALFEIDSGLCIAGPCADQSLKPITLEVDDEGVIWWVED